MKKVMDFLHHLLIPKEENNFRAKALHTDFLTYYLLFALFLTFAFKQFDLSNVLGFATDISVNKLYELTNNERTKDGLPPLNYNEQLANAARQKAQDMFANDYWAHYGPKGSSPWDFILNSGYQYEYAGENLAKNFMFSQGVLDGWMKSTTHRENILRRDYSDVGFAIVNGTLNNEPTTLVVQIFGKPLISSSLVLNKPQSKTITNPNPQTAPTTVIPPQIIISQSPGAILAKQTSNKTGFINNFSLNLNIIFMLFLLVSLIFDFYFATKYNIIRIGGKNIAHFVFIVFIFVGLWLFTKGSII